MRDSTWIGTQPKLRFLLSLGPKPLSARLIVRLHQSLDFVEKLISWGCEEITMPVRIISRLGGIT